jgi:stearoyl-CoA desaturase (delta-9 desaturase)
MPAHLSVYVFVVAPFVAMIAAVPVTWGWGLGWVEAKRRMRVALAIAGSMAVQGPILHWVADHRRHHAFSDQEGDPHSPWLFGTSPAALARGFWHAHTGWLFKRDLTNQRRFAPDLVADRDIRTNADPTCARHGVKPGQIDASARLIWLFEKVGWVYDVRWPDQRRLARITATT